MAIACLSLYWEGKFQLSHYQLQVFAIKGWLGSGQMPWLRWGSYRVWVHCSNLVKVFGLGFCSVFCKVHRICSSFSPEPFKLIYFQYGITGDRNNRFIPSFQCRCSAVPYTLLSSCSSSPYLFFPIFNRYLEHIF